MSTTFGELTQCGPSSIGLNKFKLEQLVKSLPARYVASAPRHVSPHFVELDENPTRKHCMETAKKQWLDKWATTISTKT